VDLDQEIMVGGPSLRVSFTREDSWDRMWRKVGKLEARLGEDGTKPNGMHWRTYYRILDQL
jgi:hypothetical protein